VGTRAAKVERVLRVAVVLLEEQTQKVDQRELEHHLRADHDPVRVELEQRVGLQVETNLAVQKFLFLRAVVLLDSPQFHQDQLLARGQDPLPAPQERCVLLALVVSEQRRFDQPHHSQGEIHREHGVELVGHDLGVLLHELAFLGVGVGQVEVDPEVHQEDHRVEQGKGGRGGLRLEEVAGQHEHQLDLEAEHGIVVARLALAAVVDEQPLVLEHVALLQLPHLGQRLVLLELLVLRLAQDDFELEFAEVVVLEPAL